MANGYNPFEIDVRTPAVQQGLQGLGQFATQYGQQRREDEVRAASQARFESAQRDIMAAYQSGDPNKMAEVSIKYPEFQKVTEQAFGFANRQTKAFAESTYAQVLADPANAEQYLERGIQQVADAGGRPVKMTQDLELFKRDPEAALKSVELGVATIAPDVHKAYRTQQDALVEQRKAAAEGKRFETDEELRRSDLQLRKDRLAFDQKVARAKAAGGGTLSDEDKLKFASDLRKEIDNNTKDFVKVRDAYGRIRASEDSAQGDISLIFQFMKMLDPGSVVRENEFATAEQTQGMPAWIVSRYNKAVSGERLSPSQRKKFLSQAKKLFDSQKKSAKRVYDQRVALAERQGITEDDIYGGVDFFEPQTEVVETAVDTPQAQTIGRFQVRAR